jgi:DNA-binding IclR family transcriptional regulator
MSPPPAKGQPNDCALEILRLLATAEDDFHRSLFSETFLCEQLDWPRQTIEHALEELEAQGLVRRTRLATSFGRSVRLEPRGRNEIGSPGANED